jgi:hypothetical protein
LLFFGDYFFGEFGFSQEVPQNDLSITSALSHAQKSCKKSCKPIIPITRGLAYIIANIAATKAIPAISGLFFERFIIKLNTCSPQTNAIKVPFSTHDINIVERLSLISWIYLFLPTLFLRYSIRFALASQLSFFSIVLKRKI